MQVLKQYWIFALLALLGALVVVYGAQKYGIGLAPDSVGYVQVAREIVGGKGIPNWFILQPPLYPFALAVGGLVTGDMVVGALWLNALWFAGVIFFAGLILTRHLKGFWLLAVVGTVGVIAARPLLNVALTAYSEMLFVFLMLAAFVGLEKYFETRKWKWFWLAVVATALACLTRYVGVALVAAGALAMVWVLRAERWRAVGVATLFPGLAALPLGLWLVRNVWVSGTVFGERAASRVTFLENLKLTVETFLNWFVADAWVVVFLVGLGVVLGLYVWQVVMRREQVTEKGVSLAPYAFFVVLFVVLMIVSATTTAYNRINTRLLSPLFVPSLILMVVLLDAVVDGLRARVDRRIVNVGVLILAALFAVSFVMSDVPRIQRAAEQGAGGFNTARWRTSETVAYVAAQRAELEGTLYSNGADALYILADVNAESVLPKFEYASNERAFDAAQLRGSYPPAPATLVWLNNVERDDFLFTLQEIGEFTTLTPIAMLEDGAVFRMEKRAQ